MFRNFVWIICFYQIFISVNYIDAACYFPLEFQGDFAMQSTSNARYSVQYSMLNITTTAIPIWGYCHRRIGNNFILVENYRDSCIRCLHLKLRSKNVLQILASSQQSISKCYVNEESAEANCPTEDAIRNGSISEIILFKTKDVEGKPTTKEYCPIDGRYTFSYRLNDGIRTHECTGNYSSVDSCPLGSTLNLKFRQCTFENFDLSFDCLGHWKGPKGEQFFALADRRQSNDRPQYRCAMYTQDILTGIVHIAISRDSTCNTDLYNASYGFENLILRPVSENAWPPEVSYNSCSFPEWMHGNWEHVRVEENTITYKDHTTFKTYTIKCVAMMDSRDKFSVFSRTQCGEEQYNCMRIQRRSNNILEFQLGTNFSKTNQIFDLCSDLNFEEDAWVTQGRVDPSVELACPISGEYTGLIPDTNDLCAKLWSDCRAPELMYYQVSDCETSEIYEEREYKCLGHWREEDHLYTYTQRHDVAAGTYECFVGSIISDKEDIYIKEAGEHCRRKIDPMLYNMKLIKKGLFSCIERISTTTQPTIQSSKPSIGIPTKPWNIGLPFPTIPERDNNNISFAHTLTMSYFAFLVLPFVIFM